jgi:hypothetical protein
VGSAPPKRHPENGAIYKPSQKASTLLKPMPSRFLHSILSAITRSRPMQSIFERLFNNYVFTPAVHERVRRKEFFYNAFKAQCYNEIDGDYVEFGCYGGMTFDLAYHESLRHGCRIKLWAFDSFQGLPDQEDIKDEHPAWKKGNMSCALDQFHAICAANKVPRNTYNVVPGFYKETLWPGRTENLPTNIAIAYIDCDLYTSTKTVLDFLLPPTTRDGNLFLICSLGGTGSPLLLKTSKSLAIDDSRSAATSAGQQSGPPASLRLRRSDQCSLFRGIL